jgi:Major tropism determinant N-terminal domain
VATQRHQPIQIRRGLAAEWTARNPVLAEGEEGLELDTQRSKVGNGVQRWTDLPYWGASVGGSAFSQSFTTPSLNWTVNHNLGFRPAVTVLSPGGAEVWAEVIHASVNQALVYFDAPYAGVAICS